MNYQELREAILGRKPKYSEKFKPLMERISIKGDLTGKGDFSTFGAFYQTFMYAYIIGLRLGKKTPLTNEDKKVEFADISHWKPAPIRVGTGCHWRIVLKKMYQTLSPCLFEKWRHMQIQG